MASPAAGVSAGGSTYYHATCTGCQALLQPPAQVQQPEDSLIQQLVCQLNACLVLRVQLLQHSDLQGTTMACTPHERSGVCCMSVWPITTRVATSGFHKTISLQQQRGDAQKIRWTNAADQLGDHASNLLVLFVVVSTLDVILPHDLQKGGQGELSWLRWRDSLHGQKSCGLQGSDLDFSMVVLALPAEEIHLQRSRRSQQGLRA